MMNKPILSKEHDDLYSSSDLYGSILALKPAVSAQADEIADQRRVPKKLFDQIKKTKLFETLRPRKYGGLELSPLVLFEAQIALAESDMSAGWLAGVLGVSAFHLTLYHPDAQEEVWSSAEQPVISSGYTPTGTVTRHKDGYRLTGSWGFVSGCEHSDWVFLGAKTDDGEMLVCLVEREAVTIVDTWHVTGLKGTGSHDVTAKDVVVPDHRVISVSDRFHRQTPGLREASPLYAIPFLQLQLRAISSASIGALRGFLSRCEEVNTKRVNAAQARARENPTFLAACGETAAALHSMQIVLHQQMAHMLAAAHGEAELTIADRQFYRYHSAKVTDDCCHLAYRLFQSLGGTALRLENPFGRILNDIQAARQHIANQCDAHAMAIGRLRMDPETQDLIL